MERVAVSIKTLLSLNQIMLKQEPKKRVSILLSSLFREILEEVWQKEKIKKSNQIELALQDYFEKKGYLKTDKR